MKFILLLLLTSCASQKLIDENDNLKNEIYVLKNQAKQQAEITKKAEKKNTDLVKAMEDLKKQQPECIISVVNRTGDCDEYGYCDAWIEAGDFESMMHHPYVDMAVKKCKGDVNWRKLETNIEEE